LRAVFGNKAIARIIVIQKAKDECIRVVTIRTICQSLFQVVSQLTVFVRVPDCLPRPLPQPTGPVIGGIKSVIEVIRIAGAGFSQEQQIWLNALEPPPPFGPEIGPTLLDTPGSVDSEAVHIKL